ncbi:hypothetical protein KUTeg_016181 [Tegillarca granosa]|uniref:Nipped-B protein n=1 Tax=Tegillarca granosa TaxID=220873 RepID=A0ABQ9ENZ6_TEGGR|nr:hypothetical protein KUTeg_016181 [Tegillarca granosa]
MVIMNGEVPSVPITTLAGITSLTDLLPELPLPTPLPSTVNNKSLLYHPKLAEEAKRCLRSRDVPLTQQLAKALKQTSTEHIELKDSLAGDSIDCDVPALLKTILANDPNVFKGGPGLSPSPHDQNSLSSCQIPGYPSSSSTHASQRMSDSSYNQRKAQMSSQSSKFQQSFQNFAQSSYPHNSGTMNGEISSNGQNINQNSHIVPPVTSPAQGSVAEHITKQQATKQQTAIMNDLYNSQRRSSRSEPVVLLEPLDPKTLQSIKHGGTVKAKGNHRRSVIRKKKKDKRHRRVNQKELSVEELLDSATFKRFSSCMEYIFDSSEDINFGALDTNEEEAACPPETLIARSMLAELCSETAKLKSLGVLNQVPAERLVKLLTILQWNVRDGTKISPVVNQDDDDEEDDKLWRELAMERVGRSMDAALTALYIMTSPEMPKQVYLEDVIERIILFGKFQLHNTLYPEYDPVYRIDPKAKDGYHGSLKLKRARAGQVKHKTTITLYNKMSDLVGTMAELIDIQELTDTTILQVSTLGVSPFFVENISEIQLNAMKLVTTIFSRYEKHRQLILEDIFASLARLPSSKRNLRNYRLNSEEQIQMVTALALQLIQCVIKFPSNDPSRPSSPVEVEEEPTPAKKNQRAAAMQSQKPKKPLTDDVLIVTSFETAMRTGYNFLSVFLKKCTIKGEEDYRPLFENFVQDLLSTVNKPEWPSSELLLSLLGKILVKQFSNKSVDMSLRVASLEYLGIVASRLRKDAVSSQLNQESIDEIVRKVDDDDQTQTLQKAMLDYLLYNSQSEPACWFARLFYIAQWYRDTTVEAQKAGHEDEFDATEAEKTTEVLQNVERRKQFLLSQVESTNRFHASFRPPPCKLDYESSCLVARYLSSKRPFAQSFDIYLTQILRVLSETAVAVRTKAMKCLTAVVESDPGILARNDMEKGVHGRFLDQSTSVREAAVELVGRFILIRPDLIPKYYNMLSERILDTGISVRKRVIKIFRDICLEQSDFQKIPEMCVKMIRRVNDEEGIKVAACKDTGYEFFEQLLENLLKKDEDGNFNKGALTACRQIVDCLVENVLRLEERSVDTANGKGCSQRLVACLATLHLFSKIKADLMVKHATTLQPYLDIKCNTQGDYYVLHYVSRILEMVVPLMVHPSESFLAQLEEDMIKLILKHGMMVVQSCVSCLGAVVNNVSHNYVLVKDCFQKFFGVLLSLMMHHKEDPNAAILSSRKPTLLRSLFTVGLLCKHFDFDSKDMGEAKTSVKDRVFAVLLYFVSHEDEEVRKKALTGLGFLAVRHYDYMLGKELKELYYNFLTNQDVPVSLKCQVLKNLQYYLQEEEIRMQKADAEWRAHAKEEDLKEMGDIQSGMASTIMQVYLKQVLESFFHHQSQVRLTALSVITLVLRQGLVHPVQCVPYLISMGTDCEQNIRVKADQQLMDIEKKYPGFIHKISLAEQVYIADNLCFFPYQSQDEPLFIINQIDIIVSVSGSNLLQSFKEGLQNNQVDENGKVADDDDDDLDSLKERLPEDLSPLIDVCRLSQGCILLLHVKQHLKDMYGFTDSKIHNYSPADAKAYDKPISRKAVLKFNPKTVLDVLMEGTPHATDSEEFKTKLINDYLEFKDLMLSIDPPDEDDSDDAKSTGRNTPTPGKQREQRLLNNSSETPKESEQEGGGGEVVEITSNDTSTEEKSETHVASTPNSLAPRSSRHHDHHHHHRHHISSSDKKKKPVSSRTLVMTFSSPKPKPKKPKKKKKRYKSDSDDDSDDDPDFVL